MLLNLKFYEILSKNEDMKNDIKFISKALNSIDEQITIFKEGYGKAFYHSNMSFYCSHFSPVLSTIVKPCSFDPDQIEQIRNFNFRYFMKDITSNCHQFIEETKKNITIFSPETIVQELNCTDELCFNLMNKWISYSILIFDLFIKLIFIFIKKIFKELFILNSNLLNSI